MEGASFFYAIPAYGETAGIFTCSKVHCLL